MIIPSSGVSSCQPCPGPVWPCLMGLCTSAKDWPFILLHQPEFASVLPGAYSKVQMTAILTWNGAFVPDYTLELVSKPHILPSSPTGVIFLCQAGIKQNSVRAILPQALVIWSVETKWPT